MWADDFPHSDSTWPWSQDLSEAQKERILCKNVAELYRIDLEPLHR